MTAIIGMVGLGYLVIPKQTAEAKPNTMVGSWDAQIITTYATVNCLMTISSDGTILGEDPSPSDTTTHGNWVSSGSDQIKYTLRYIVTSSDPTSSNEGKVVGEFNYDRDTDSISGPFQLTEYDPQGNVVFEAGGTIAGTRIPVESLK